MARGYLLIPIVKIKQVINQSAYTVSRKPPKYFTCTLITYKSFDIDYGV